MQVTGLFELGAQGTGLREVNLLPNSEQLPARFSGGLTVVNTVLSSYLGLRAQLPTVDTGSCQKGHAEHMVCVDITVGPGAKLTDFMLICFGLNKENKLFKSKCRMLTTPRPASAHTR